MAEYINLIFGFANKGAEVLRIHNLHHQHSSQSSMTAEVLMDLDQLNMIRDQVSNTGIIPRQIFVLSHPLCAIFRTRPISLSRVLRTVMRLFLH
jgi:hypothetical protein